MDYEYEESVRVYDEYHWTANRRAQRRAWWIKIAKKEAKCAICPPNGGENVHRNYFPRWKRKRDKAKSKRKGRC